MDATSRVSDLERLGGGREAEVFAWENGRVLRLAHDSGRAAAVEREATAMEAAGSAGAPVPALYERVSVDGRPGVIVERVDGASLLTRLGRRPWSVLSVGRALGRLHARLHQIAAPAGLPHLRTELTASLRSESVPPDVRDSRLRELDELEDGDRLCHGDFHPANVLSHGDRLFVIDWTGGASGPPAADVARTALMLQAAERPPDAPPRVAWLERAGRRLLLAAYLRAYRREQPLDLALVERWLPVCAAARLADRIDAERPRMLAVARDARSSPGQPPAMGIPRAGRLPSPHRRWLVQNALLVTALVNAILNAGIAWASAGGSDELPLWSARVGETNIVADTLGTFFLLPLITCFLVTTAVRRELAAGRLARLGFGDAPLPLLDLLPRSILVRGLVLGALVVATLGPPAVACLALIDPGFGAGAFVAYKVVLTVVLGALVTPLIALRAMADPA